MLCTFLCAAQYQETLVPHRGFVSLGADHSDGIERPFGVHA